MAGRQAAEDFAHRLGDPKAHRDEVAEDAAALEDVAEAGIVGELAADQPARDRHAEEDVFGDRRLIVVARGIEGLDEIGHAGLVEGREQALARLDDALGKLGVRARIDHAGEAEAVDVVLHARRFAAGREGCGRVRPRPWRR